MWYINYNWYKNVILPWNTPSSTAGLLTDKLFLLLFILDQKSLWARYINLGERQTLQTIRWEINKGTVCRNCQVSLSTFGWVWWFSLPWFYISSSLSSSLSEGQSSGERWTLQTSICLRFFSCSTSSWTLFPSFLKWWKLYPINI